MKTKQEIKTISHDIEDKFTEIVNELLANGWRISSTYCGFVNSESYDFCGSYQAILIREVEL